MRALHRPDNFETQGFSCQKLPCCKRTHQIIQPTPSAFTRRRSWSKSRLAYVYQRCLPYSILACRRATAQTHHIAPRPFTGPLRRTCVKMGIQLDDNSNRRRSTNPFCRGRKTRACSRVERGDAVQKQHRLREVKQQEQPGAMVQPLPDPGRSRHWRVCPKKSHEQVLVMAAVL